MYRERYRAIQLKANHDRHDVEIFLDTLFAGRKMMRTVGNWDVDSPEDLKEEIELILKKVPLGSPLNQYFMNTGVKPGDFFSFCSLCRNW